MVDDGGKTNKDTDWRFQAPLNPQVLSPLMAQRGIEVVGGRQFTSENTEDIFIYASSSEL